MGKFTFSVIMVLLLVAGQAGSAAAAEVSGLYEAEIGVRGQGAAERIEAFRDALAQVLVKVTGQRDINAQPVAAALRSRVQSIVQQYRYRTPAAGSGRLLWAAFDAEVINQALWQHHVAVWGTARPLALILLAMEDSGQRMILEAEGDQQLTAIIKAAALQRGIPVLLPLMDLEDRSTLKFTDVWGNFRSSLMVSARRYQSDAILVGRLYRAGSQWEGRWSLHVEGLPLDWSFRGSVEDVITAAINNTADVLASKYARPAMAVTGSGVLLKVMGVDSLEDYAHISTYLQGLQVVSEIKPVTVSASDVLFRLQLRSDRQSLVQALALSSRQLVPVEVPAVAGDPRAATAAPLGAELVYRMLK
jgi:hypothetical protein